MTWEEHEKEYLGRFLDTIPKDHYGWALTYGDACRTQDCIEEDEYYAGPILEIARCKLDGLYYVMPKE